MNKFENDYIVFFSDGTKAHLHIPGEDVAEQAKDVCPENAVVSFVTNARDDLPFDYDWDENLKCWQARIF